MSANPYSQILQPEDCVLLLVDIQKTMLDLCVDGEQVLQNSGALIEIAKLYKIPVIFSEHNSGKLGGFLPQLVERVDNPQVLNKMEFNCLANPGLSEAVSNTGRKTILLAGIETHACIFHTGSQALRLGYTVHVAADSVASRSRLNRQVGLRRLDRAGAVISSTEMIIFELLKEAGTKEFRAALPLLKTL